MGISDKIMPKWSYKWAHRKFWRKIFQIGALYIGIQRWINMKISKQNRSVGIV